MENPEQAGGKARAHIVSLQRITIPVVITHKMVIYRKPHQ